MIGDMVHESLAPRVHQTIKITEGAALIKDLSGIFVTYSLYGRLGYTAGEVYDNNMSVRSKER